ncbi:MAG: ParB/RepB/Spo0J family partition protein [Leptospiraceae bacterium]|nr:ParB/RepB/Spo0J family partition protein [Leptospiraceae bacterium]
MSKKNDFSTLDLISAYEGKSKSTEKLSLKDIEPSPNQPRQFGKENVDDLVDSMKRMGLIEPIVVRKNNSKYMIVAGERRFHAAERLGWTEIPAIITEANPELCYEMALAENEKRKSLNPWEVGKAIQYLRKERKKTALEVGEILGYTERYVKQLSSIARLDLKHVSEFIGQGNEPSVKNLERLLKFKEGRGGETSSPSPKKEKISINLKPLSQKQRDSFLKEIKPIAKKYGIEI